jgi:polysaccharide export outer membrane protein
MASAVGALLAAVAPCAAQSATGNAAVAAKIGAQSAPTAAAPGITADYVIGPDDVMSVVFWHDKDLSADVTVRPDGKISLPLLNEIQAAGLTVTQLTDRIAEAAKQYVVDATVTVGVKAINSRKVYITGEVRKPGPYPLTGTTTVLQLIAVAGGLGDYAKGEKITIVRVEAGRQTAFRFNYKDVLKGRKLAQNIELKPGDAVLVP